MLTADAYGVLPPIARLTPDAAMYHFLSGYTARVAGTEKGVTEPKADVQHLLRRAVPAAQPERLRRACSARRSPSTRRAVWLVNTGWTGGPYGVGSRMKIAHTRAMITAALTGQLDNVAYQNAPDLQPRRADHAARACPTACSTRAAPGPTPPKYDEQAKKLAQMFVENFKTFESRRRAGGEGRPGPRGAARARVTTAAEP